MPKSAAEQPLHRRIREILEVEFAALPANTRVPAARALAERFGVSYMTVTRALNDLENKGLLERVRGSGSFTRLNTAERGQPIYFALPSTVIFRYPVTFFSVTAYGGALQEARDSGVKLEMLITGRSNTQNDLDREVLDNLAPYSRVIVAGYWFYPIFPWLQRKHCRVSFLDNQDEAEPEFARSITGFHKLRLARTELAAQGVKLLHDAGRRHILLLHSGVRYDVPWRRGYREGLAACGLEYNPHIELFTNRDQEMVMDEMAISILSRRRHFFDAILAVSYVQAVGAYQALRRAQLTVPKDVSILALEDNPALERNPLPLSAIGFDYEMAGRMALRQLLADSPEPLVETVPVVENFRCSI